MEQDELGLVDLVRSGEHYVSRTVYAWFVCFVREAS